MIQYTTLRSESQHDAIQLIVIVVNTSVLPEGVRYTTALRRISCLSSAREPSTTCCRFCAILSKMEWVRSQTRPFAFKRPSTPNGEGQPSATEVVQTLFGSGGFNDLKNAVGTAIRSHFTALQ